MRLDTGSYVARKVQYKSTEAFAGTCSASLLTKHLIKIVAPDGRLAYLALLLKYKRRVAK
jgi:hypothetical protein